METTNNKNLFLSIIIPAFNEECRLVSPLNHLYEFLKQSRNNLTIENVEVIIIDDGSLDNTKIVAKENLKKFVHSNLFELRPNQGKGAAVKKGLEISKGQWVLISDADMSTPWTEVVSFFEYINKNSSTDIVIGSRAHKDSKINNQQPYFRQAMGRCFNLLIRIITGLSFRDTQCGFKLSRGEMARSCGRELKTPRFAWDVDFLMIAKAKKATIVDLPVTWNHVEASRVNPISDSLEMLFAVLKLRYKRIVNKFVNLFF
jgi:glycosyltransferase involved in cell wall biosynthesis